tara:strand:- start:26 stop:643 length:618 start_codon:yes stop_codon:yes gene_type:complete
MTTQLLIVEDDELYASTLKRRLTKHSFVCALARNKSDALLLSKQLSPDVILLDMHLAGESGLSIIKPLRASVPKAKIILLTGYASIATAVEAIKLGADDYLAKPVDTTTLLNTIGNAGTKVGADTGINAGCNAGFNAGAMASQFQQEEHVVMPETLSSEQLEWEHIHQVLKANDGNVSAAARQLSMHRRTLQRKLKKRPSFADKS